jgi:transposase InsO family protein
MQHCGRFGVPNTIRSDRGSQFVNELIAELCKLMGTEQELSTSYSHEENAIVERANKEVMRHLRAMIFHDRVYSNWSTDQLPLVMRIMNSEEKVSTGVSPAELLFGNTVNLGRQLLYRTSEKGEVPTQKLSKFTAFWMSSFFSPSPIISMPPPTPPPTPTPYLPPPPPHPP